MLNISRWIRPGVLHRFPLSRVDLVCGEQCLAHHVLILVVLIWQKRKDQVITIR